MRNVLADSMQNNSVTIALTNRTKIFSHSPFVEGWGPENYCSPTNDDIDQLPMVVDTKFNRGHVL